MRQQTNQQLLRRQAERERPPPSEPDPELQGMAATASSVVQMGKGKGGNGKGQEGEGKGNDHKAMGSNWRKEEAFGELPRSVCRPPEGSVRGATFQWRWCRCGANSGSIGSRCHTVRHRFSRQRRDRTEGGRPGATSSSRTESLNWSQI